MNISDMQQYPVQRNDTNDGWLVNAHFRSKVFLDKDHDHSVQNSFVEATNYACSTIEKSKRRFTVDRNCSFIDKTNRKGETERFVRITRPLGGYKFFKLENSSGINGLYTQTEYDQAIQLACKWFMDEREKCSDIITSRNNERKKERKKTRHSFLFGDPTIGLPRFLGK